MPVWTVVASPAGLAEAGGVSTVTVSAGGVTFPDTRAIALSLVGTATKDTDYIIAAASLALAAGDTEVSTTVTGVDDLVDEDDETVVVTAGLGATTLGSATVTIVDDDVPAWTVMVEPETIAEAGGVSTVTVSAGGVTFPDTRTVTLSLAGTATKDTDYTIAAASLTLAAGDTEVSTTVTGVDDLVDEDDETVVVTANHGASAVGSPATITILDDDIAGVTVSPTSLTVAEGESESWTLVLDTQPAAAVTITVARQAGGDASLTAAPTSLTFTSASWRTPQPVTVTANEDPDSANGAATFVHTAISADPFYAGIAMGTVEVTEADNDPPGVTVSPTSLTVAEGESESWTLVLDTQPAVAVTITVARQAGGDASLTAAPSSLVFTPANWWTPQPVTVTAARDADTVNGSATFGHTATGADTVYAGIAIDSVEVTEADDRAATLRGWLARFGRTVTGQVLDAVHERLEAPHEAGMRGRLAGQALSSPAGGAGDSAAYADARSTSLTCAHHHAAADGTRTAPPAPAAPAAAAIRDGGCRNAGRPGSDSEEVTRRAFVTGTSFTLTEGSAEVGGFATLWGPGGAHELRRGASARSRWTARSRRRSPARTGGRSAGPRAWRSVTRAVRAASVTGPARARWRRR